jgi:hypothetical protein
MRTPGQMNRATRTIKNSQTLKRRRNNPFS